MPIPTSLEKISGETPTKSSASLPTSVTQTLQRYFEALQQKDPVNLYQTVIDEVEIPLLKFVMEHYRYNQSQVAHILGLSRGTLRTKLRHHFHDQYVGTRADHKRAHMPGSFGEQETD